ncbi:hypothetical protein HUU05_07420 [candidate division KSB1 bacterium]|nr:hypothetical protein [candidate division KSB1 bacterium]
MEVVNIQPCPLCSGHKKVFQETLFREALRTSDKKEKRMLTTTSFVRDCSVCAGNGWVKSSMMESAKHEAEAWRLQGICRY